MKHTCLLALTLPAVLLGCAPDCDDVQSQFTVQLEQIRQAHAACQTVDDCTAVLPENSCRGLCGLAVAKAKSAAFQAEVQAMSDELCGPSFGNACGMSTPSCVQGKLACTAGRCESSFP